MDIQPNLDGIVRMLKHHLGTNLTGIYLHGSLAMGCFHPNKSDIDILVVVQRKIATERLRSIAEQLIALEEALSIKRGIELSILLEYCLSDSEYPVPFEFHYSAFHRKKYKKDPLYICGGYKDPDLAAHLTVTFHRGITVYGKAIKDVFKPVDPHFYVQSIIYDIENALNEIQDHPVYYTLNLCRVLHYLKEGAISSKKEAGNWGLEQLPTRFVPLIQSCLDEYADLPSSNDLQNRELKEFTIFMMNTITEQLQLNSDKGNTL
ncbi:aminoglycoside adenylyltransferase domain-containing protein [Bacillus sp. 1P06AnD]|uniref:aminoglycoside adenylyltransferase domain-containing protein n=1 Tax=Bacillus sp. 1P06AnD TaxID=3132208 RepID=UPI0039A29D9D